MMQRPCTSQRPGRVRVVTALAVAAAVALLGGGAIVATQEPQAPPDTPTFRVGTRLATIDAVVVDQKGKHVTDLTPADLEVVERGTKQTVRQVLYVRAVPAGSPATAPAPVSAEPAVPPVTTGTAAPRPRPLASGTGLAHPERTGRVLAIVVDDLGLSFESTAYVRKMLTNYVDTRMAPGDLVAVIRTA